MGVGASRIYIAGFFGQQLCYLLIKFSEDHIIDCVQRNIDAVLQKNSRIALNLRFRLQNL